MIERSPGSTEERIKKSLEGGREFRPTSLAGLIITDKETPGNKKEISEGRTFLPVLVVSGPTKEGLITVCPGGYRGLIKQPCPYRLCRRGR
jgi:hypothetical protein